MKNVLMPTVPTTAKPLKARPGDIAMRFPELADEVTSR